MHAQRVRNIATGALLFVAVVAGWTAYDLSLVATGGEPYLIPGLLPGYASALIVAAVTGALCAFDRRVLWLCLALTAAAAIVPKFYRLDLAWHLICLPRAVFLLLAAFLAARSMAQRSRPAFWPAVGLGTIAAATFATYLGMFRPLPAAALTAGSLLIASAALRQSGLRRMTTAAVLLISLSLVVAFARHNTQLPRPDRPHAAATLTNATGPSLILIVLDTVSAHHLAPYGYQRVTTPGLDAFVRENMIRYTQARSVSSWTLPSHASIFTGLYPSEHGADHLRPASHEGNQASAADQDASVKPQDGGTAPRPAEPLRSDVTTLAEHLTAAGYQTGAITANNGYLKHDFGIDRGFEHYDDRGAFSSLSSSPMLLLQLAGFQQHLRKGDRLAETITDLAIRWIDAPERRQPFFLFLNYMDAHAPYVPPSPHHRAFGPEQPRDPLTYELSLSSLLYDRELRYLDAHLTRFLATLEARSLLNDALLIITSDHGEAFGEHGFWGHERASYWPTEAAIWPTGCVRGCGSALYEDLIRVPLYVKPVGPPRPGVSDRPLTTPGLYQLIVAELGLSAASTITDSPIVAEWYECNQIANSQRAKRLVSRDQDLLVWFSTSRKWIVGSRGDVEAYDLRVDPGELHPLPLTRDQIEKAQESARAWWDANPPVARAEHTSPALDPVVLERLRNLGYFH